MQANQYLAWTPKRRRCWAISIAGVTDAIEPTIVNDHDFPSQGNGKVIPHGIYDLGKNKALVHLNTSKDTSEFSCECQALWWLSHSRRLHDNIFIRCVGVLKMLRKKEKQ